MKITALILSFFTFVSSLLWGAAYPEYSKISEKAADIPGLKTDFVPQGSTYLADEDSFICCGYMENGDPSRLYVMKDGAEMLVILSRQDGSKYAGHAGGVTAAGEFIYVSNAEKLFVLKKDDVISAKDGDTVSFVGSVPVPCRASFCSCDGETVYVGEYHAKDYETDDSHILKTPDGGEYSALVFGYAVNPDSQFGINSEKPTVAYSVCDKVQGFAATDDGRAVLSVSGGVMSSKLKIYKTGGEPDGEFEIEGEKIPLIYLDSGRAEKEITIPRMSEDLEFCKGKILVAYEAAAKKFVSGILPFSEKRMMLVTV